MLDAGLPPALVVGRTLSAYTTAAIVNNQETITYTVYNEQADPLTGVLLTDTLAPGETFVNPSQLPDQSGQKLAWSLGTIQGYDRASVTITLVLPTPFPAQLDTGARHSPRSTPGPSRTPRRRRRCAGERRSHAARLHAGRQHHRSLHPGRSGQAQLRPDRTSTISCTTSRLQLVSRLSARRRGTLWSGAGNALDVASLGVALMRARAFRPSTFRERCRRATAQQLILSMFPASDQTVGYIPAGTQTADPVNDPQLLSETESHYWFQFDAGSGMTNTDPLMAGATIGQTFTTATGTFTEVAAAWATTEVSLTAEIYARGLRRSVLAMGCRIRSCWIRHSMTWIW